MYLGNDSLGLWERFPDWAISCTSCFCEDGNDRHLINEAEKDNNKNRIKYLINKRHNRDSYNKNNFRRYLVISSSSTMTGTSTDILLLFINLKIYLNLCAVFVTETWFLLQKQKVYRLLFQ